MKYILCILIVFIFNSKVNNYYFLFIDRGLYSGTVTNIKNNIITIDNSDFILTSRTIFYYVDEINDKKELVNQASTVSVINHKVERVIFCKKFK